MNQIRFISSRSQMVLGLLMVGNLQVDAATLRFDAISRRADRNMELRFQTENGKTFFIERSGDLRTWSAMATVNGDGQTASVVDSETAGSPMRFYRIKSASAQKPFATLPAPGMIYPEGTTIGGALFGVEFTIPAKWKGGLQTGSPLMLFGSDTEPGIVLETIGFAGTREQILQDQYLKTGFESNLGTMGNIYFQPTDRSNPIKTIGDNRISAEYAGYGQNGYGGVVLVYWNLEVLVHPSGGYLVFMGITTQEYQARLKEQLVHFVNSAKISSRPTNTALMDALNGRTFKWTGESDWYKNTPFGTYVQSASLSSWSENYASFCSQGTFEVSRSSETYASTISPSQGFMGIGGSSTSTEYGQWTVVQSPDYGDLVIMATLKGYQIMPIRVSGNGVLDVGGQQMTFYKTSLCN